MENSQTFKSMNLFKEKVLYFDNHIIVAYKDAGILSQGDRTGDASILDFVKDFIKVEFKKPGEVFVGSVHRLDRPAMGLMLFAKTSKALGRLNELFRKREIHKEYLVIVSGKLKNDSAELVNYLQKDHQKNIVKCYDTPGTNRKKAILNYALIKYIEGYSLLKIQLLTGRSHQIRAQLASIGHPILGDLKYGSQYPTDGKSICLLSHSLTFVHPVTKEEMRFSIGIPANMKYWEIFNGYTDTM